jgi:hypothetical protein
MEVAGSATHIHAVYIGSKREGVDLDVYGITARISEVRTISVPGSFL